MKGLIGTILFGLLGFGTAFAVHTWLSGELDKAQFEAKLQEARVKFALESGAVAAAPDERRDADRRSLMSAHQRRLKGIYENHPKQNIEDKYIKNAEQKAKEGKRNKAKVAAVAKRYEWLKKMWNSGVKTGNYTAKLTGYKNGVRVDILDITPVTSEKNGKTVLRMNLLVWGPAKDQFVFGDYTISFREGDDDDGKKKKKKSDDPEDGLSKIEWAGSPLIYHPEGKNPSPSKYIEAWPPTLGVGYWEGLPLLPSTVKKIDLEMNFSLRNTGGTTLPVEFKWESVEVDSSWQLGEGAEFKHDVTETIQE